MAKKVSTSHLLTLLRMGKAAATARRVEASMVVMPPSGSTSGIMPAGMARSNEPVTAETDLRRILAIQALRAAVYGFGAVILGSALEAEGRSQVETGVLFAAMLAGTAGVSLLVGFLSERVGRRRAYMVLIATMGLAGIVFALAGPTWALIAVALTGTMSTDANESGPITSLEQAMIGGAPAATRVHVFGRYNAIAYLAGAVGALAAGGPVFLRGIWDGAPADRTWLLAFPLASFACLMFARGLTPSVEAHGDRPTRVPLSRSRRHVIHLAGLFALDSFAGGFVVTTFVVFWFAREFGASAGTMSLVIFAGGLLQAASSIVAARLGARFGLLRTMVFTHLPSNVLLAAVPFAPSLGFGIAILLARFALSQMDVPTRQAYIAAMVDAEERVAAAAFTNAARYMSRPLGPLAGAALTVAVGAGGPFVAAGALKIIYDLAIWSAFKRVSVDEG